MRWTERKKKKISHENQMTKTKTKQLILKKNGHLLAKMIGEKKANDTCERHFSRKNKTLVAIVENDRNQLIDWFYITYSLTYFCFVLVFIHYYARQVANQPASQKKYSYFFSADITTTTTIYLPVWLLISKIFSSFFFIDKTKQEKNLQAWLVFFPSMISLVSRKTTTEQFTITNDNNIQSQTMAPMAIMIFHIQAKKKRRKKASGKKKKEFSLLLLFYSNRKEKCKERWSPKTTTKQNRNVLHIE